MSRTFLTEELVALKNQQYSSIDIGALVQILKYSPDSDDLYSKSELTLEFDQDMSKADLNNFVDSLFKCFKSPQCDIGDQYNSSTVTDDIILKIQQPDGKSASIEVNYPYAKSGILMKAFKYKKLQGVFPDNKAKPSKNSPSTPLTSADLLSLKNAFLICSALLTKPEEMTLEKCLDSVTLLQPGQDLSKTDLEVFNKAIKPQKIRLICTCDSYRIAFLIFCYYAGGEELFYTGNLNKDSLESKVLSAEQLKTFYECLKVDAAKTPIDRLLLQIAYHEVTANKKTFEQVSKLFEEFEISKKIPEFISTVTSRTYSHAYVEADEELRKTGKPFSEEDKKLRAQKIGKKLLDTKLAGFTKAKSLDELKAALQNEDIIVDKTDQARLTEKLLHTWPSPTHPCAKRRLRLFEDLLADESTPRAQVFSNQDFIVGLTFTRSQNHIFGRNKPVCIPGSVTEVDEQYNSMSAKGEFKEVRDKKRTILSGHCAVVDQNGQERYVVEDNIGSDLTTESNWCTTATEQYGGSGAWDKVVEVSYWSNYNNRGQKPYVIIMEVKTGRLYQYAPASSDSSIRFEDEYAELPKGALVTSRIGNFPAQISKARKTYATLDVILSHVLSTYFDVKEEDLYIDQLINTAKTQKILTTNNRLILRNASVASTFAPLFSLVNGIIIATPKPQERFFNSCQSLSYIPPIDLNHVKEASQLFEALHYDGTLVLKNTDKIEDMSAMFANCRIPEIVGLNTSKAKNLNRIFQGAVGGQLAFSTISFPTLDFSSCETADFAFTSCNAKKIQIINAQKLKSCTQAFINCRFLTSFPNLVKDQNGNVEKLFPLCNSTGFGIDGDDSSSEDTSNTDDNASLLFDGCFELHKNPDFKATCQKITKAYRLYSKKTTEVEVDERGYLVIRTSKEARQLYSKFHTFPGVKVACKDATALFAGYSQLRFNSVDLSEVENAESLFSGSTILKLDRIEGLEHVKHANRMFYQCRCDNYPELIFTSYEGKFDVFYYAEPPVSRYLPTVKPGPKAILPGVKSLYTSAENPIRDSVLAFLGHTTSTTWFSSLGTARVTEWYSKLVYLSYYNTFYSQLIDSNNIDDDGILTIHEAGSLTPYLKAEKFSKDEAKISAVEKILGIKISRTPKTLSSIKKIKIDNSNAELFFEYVTLPKDITLPELDMTSVVNASGMFRGFRGKLSTIITSNQLTCIDGMFNDARVNKIPTFNVDGVTEAVNAFTSLEVEQAFPSQMLKFRSLKVGSNMFSGFTNGDHSLNLSELEMPNLERATYMFQSCYLTLESLHLPNLLDANSMFRNCTYTNPAIKNIEFPQADISHLFANSAIKSIAMLKTLKPNGVCRGVFSYCRTLEVVGSLIIPNAEDASQMFAQCDNLKLIIPIKTKFPTSTSFRSSYMFSHTKLLRRYGKHGEFIKARNQAQAR